MSDTPANQRSWWRQPPLWVGAAPLLIFLLVSAIDLALAKQFTDNGKAVISDALGGVWQWMVVLLFLIALILAISRLAEDGESVVEATVIAAFLLEAEPLGVAIGQCRVDRVVSPEHGPYLQFG